MIDKAPGDLGSACCGVTWGKSLTVSSRTRVGVQRMEVKDHPAAPKKDAMQRGGRVDTRLSVRTVPCLGSKRSAVTPTPRSRW